MGRFSLRLVLILLALVLAVAACKQPTTDPDQALRDLIVNKTWYHDDTNYPSETNPENFLFNPDGTGFTHGGTWTFTWTIVSGTLTITWTGVATTNAADVTSSLAITSTTLVITYLQNPIHLTTIP
jgi:hypothetical protein